MQRKFIIKESNLTEKPTKRLCLVRVTVIAQDNTPFLAKVISASSGAMIGLFLILILFRLLMF